MMTSSPLRVIISCCGLALLILTAGASAQTQEDVAAVDGVQAQAPAQQQPPSNNASGSPPMMANSSARQDEDWGGRRATTRFIQSNNRINDDSVALWCAAAVMARRLPSPCLSGKRS